jgi:hypothetical protein
MIAVREKDSADFDLEAFIDLFDEALTSDDPSVQKTLQHLMVIAALARNHARHDQRNGPLRRLFDDQKNIIRRLDRLESDQQNKRVYPGGGLGGGNVPPGPYVPPSTPWPNTGGGTGWPPQHGTYPPGTIWAQGTSTSETSVTIPSNGAVAKSTTSYAYDPSPVAETVAERIGDLLQSDYRGSTVGKIHVSKALDKTRT